MSTSEPPEDQDVPRKPVQTPEETRRAIFEALDNLRQTHMARINHGTLAELSRIAALAVVRLDQANSRQDTAERNLAVVRVMLQKIEAAGHQAYLEKHGTEEDYQAIGAKTEKKYCTPSGRWRG